MKARQHLGIGLTLLVVASSWAVESPPPSTSPLVSKDEAASKDLAIRTRIASKLPPASAQDVRLIANGALYEVNLGDRIMYVTPGGEFLIAGDLYDLHSKQNLTEQNRVAARKVALVGIKDSDVIIFEPDGAVKHTITVFTDPDCTYCRKLQTEIAAINKLGIRVRYAAFPRSGPNSESWIKTEAVWCSKDRRDAFTRATQGQSIYASECKSPVEIQYQIGQRMGAHGTPMIITEDAILIQGYLPPQQLAARLDELLAQTNETRVSATNRAK